MQCGRVGSRLLSAGAPRILYPRGSFFCACPIFQVSSLCLSGSPISANSYWELSFSFHPFTRERNSFSCCLPCNLHPIPLAFWRWVLSFKVCKYSFYSIPSFHSFSIFCFQFLNWYILLAYVFFVSSIATAANRNITALSDGIEVLILVRLYVVKQKCTTWAPIKFGVLI